MTLTITMVRPHGPCFSVKPDVDIPPSLVNIYQSFMTVLYTE